MAKAKEENQFDNVAHVEEQEELGAIIHGRPMSEEQVEADRKFQENHAAQQRAAYPEIYRKADELRAQPGYRPAASPNAAPLTTFPATRVMEPGHDPGLQDATEAANPETAGVDNLAPHETTSAVPPVNPHGTATDTE